MSIIERTNYPRFAKRRKLNKQELEQGYSISSDEHIFINTKAKTELSKLNFAIQLKSFQILGYFVGLDKVPEEVINHIRQQLKIHYKIKAGYSLYNKTIYRHRNTIKDYLGIQSWIKDFNNGKAIHKGMKSAIKIAYRSSEYMNNIADIINATIEGLIQENFELPTFYLLDRLVRHTRHTVNNRIFQQTHSLLLLDNKIYDLERLLKISSNGKSFFNELKVTPKQPTYKRFKEYMEHFNWLKSLGEFDKYLKDIAKVKIDQFAQEALDSTVSEIKELLPFKKYTLLVCLIYKQQRIAIDILATMFCRLLLSANKQAKSTLKSQFDNSKEETSRVLNILKTLVEDGLNIKNYCTLAKTFYSRMRQAGGLEKLHDDCSNLIAINGSDYRGFLSKKVSDKRAMLFEIINALNMKSASQDQSLIKALEYLRKNNNKKSKYLTEPIDLSFATDYWRKRIIKTGVFTDTKYNRKEIEACVFNYTQKALNAGDIFIDQGDIFSDYRSEFIPWDECFEHLDSLCESSEIPNNADELLSSLKQEMIDKARSLDNKYLKQNDFVINPDDGRPIRGLLHIALIFLNYPTPSHISQWFGAASFPLTLSNTFLTIPLIPMFSEFSEKTNFLENLTNIVSL